MLDTTTKRRIPTANKPSLSVAASLSRPNAIGIQPDGQGDAGCYNPQSKIPTPKAKPQSQPRQRDIRRALIEADREVPSAEVRTPNRVSPTSTFEIHPSNFASIPGQLFYSTQIPVCLWFREKNKAAYAKRGFRDRLEVKNQLALAA